MKTIYYVGYYDRLRDGKAIRSYSLAGAKKMDYLINVLTGMGKRVEVLSNSYVNVSEGGKYPALEEKLTDNVTLSLPTSWGARHKPMRVVRVLWGQLSLFCRLMKRCRKNDTVLVYHNYGLALPVVLAHSLKHFNLILEIEEQYQMVWNLSPYQKWKENLLLKHGKKNSLVVSEVLADHMGIKDPIVSYGNYSTYRGELPKKDWNGTIELVYTGSIDSVKGSAFAAVEMMRYLPKQYVLKLSGVLGKGDEKAFYDTMNTVNTELGREACSYLGVLDDESYRELLLHAHIALNLQQEGDFGSFLFPSKILTYMSYGLPVISTKGESIVRSAVAEHIVFAEDFTPESAAQAVLGCKGISGEKIIAKLDELNDVFTKKLNAVLK